MLTSLHIKSQIGLKTDKVGTSALHKRNLQPLLYYLLTKKAYSKKGLIFSWSPVLGAVRCGFWVRVVLNGDNSTKVYSETVYGTSFSIPAAILLTGKIYGWAVCALDQNNNLV